MDDATKEKILKWIEDNHEHHSYEDIERQDGSGIFDEKWSDCTDSSFPYVNSIELEKFIKSL